MGTIEDIKDRLDIVEITRGYVKLERSGARFRALCPFHNEKTASFFVFPDSQRWRCFGACDKGGDVFDFVMAVEGWDYRAAMVELARQAGVELPRWSEKRQREAEQRRGREGVFEVAARFWEGALPGSEGERYALGRGWTEETIQGARLGYCDGEERAKLRTALEGAGVDLASGPARAVLGIPSGSLVYPHTRGGKVTYVAARGVEKKVHWNPPRELVGQRWPFFNHIYRHNSDLVVVVEGQGDGVTLAQWGIAGVALAGVVGDEQLLGMLRRHRTVVVGLDWDETGKEKARRLANGLGPMVRMVRWPGHDVNDWLQEGGTAEECEELLREAPVWLEVLIEETRLASGDEEDGLLREVFAAMVHLDPFALAKYRENVARELGLSLGVVDGLLRAARQEAGLDASGRPLYQVIGGKICRRSYGRMGEEQIVPLCNFTAEIVEDVVEDDGELQQRRFSLEGKLADGRKLALVEVEAGDFSQMGWVLPEWGARATVAAGGTMRDHLRVAIQTLSQDIEVRYEYSHLGWRRVNGRQVYLSAAGAVGMEDVQVRMIQDLAAYRLPTWPGNQMEAMRASLGFLEVGDYEVTIPLWAAMYLAPLASVLPPSFTVWMFGTTGTLKSTLTALALCHFGKFAYNTPPASWTGTANALEKKAFLVKDSPLWIDDYTAQSTMAGMKEIQRKADQLLRDWGNRSGRSRMRADLKLRQTFVPRGLIISTAEQLPPGQSILSRLYAIEVHPGMVSRGAGSALTRAQLEESGLYPMAMAGYVNWLSDWWDQVEKVLPERSLEYMERARAEGQHLRMPMNVATMYIGLEMGLKYAVQVGAIGEDDLEAMLETGWAVLLGIGEQQHQVVVEEKPVELYLSALEQMFAAGTVYLKHKDTPELTERMWPSSRVPAAEHLGWYDEQYWYLLPQIAYQRVWQFYRASGVIFPDSGRGIRVKMKEQGLLFPQGGRYTYRLRVGDIMPRVLRIVPWPILEQGDISGAAGTAGTMGNMGTEKESLEREVPKVPF